MDDLVQLAQVHDYWNGAACGETAYAKGETVSEQLTAQTKARYELEPYIFDFAKFHEGAGKSVLEIGVGMGADHEQWAKHKPARLCGIDLTERAIELTSWRLRESDLQSELRVADAENLPFEDESFDVVYSWGVAHHSPNPPKILREISRVLRSDGVARIMIYHKWSIVGMMLWARYGAFRKTLAQVYAEHLESPGTKAYSVWQAGRIFKISGLKPKFIRVELSSGDLLTGAAGQQHQGLMLSTAKLFWPRWLLKKFARSCGLFLLIEARKIGR